MTDMVWEDPPPLRPPRAKWTQQFVDQLRAHPGKWARVRTGSGSIEIDRPTVSRLKKLGCEVEYRKLPESDRKLHAWARWPEHTDDS